MTKYVNVHGRRGGRGLRPWLLLPKVLGAGAYFGGLLAALALIVAADPQTAQDWRELTNQLRVLFVYVAVPGLTLAIVMGVLLLWQSGWVLWRMRWMKVKTGVVVATVPLLHLFMSDRLATVRQAGEGGAAMTQFTVGLGAAIGLAVAVIVLGRHKPRMGQGVATAGKRRADVAEQASETERSGE